MLSLNTFEEALTRSKKATLNSPRSLEVPFITIPLD